MDNTNDPTRIKKGQNALKHGGGAARAALTAGKEFTGLAREVEKQVQADYEIKGPSELLKTDAIRMHTAAELYWSAILGAIEEGDMPKFESYVKSYGWLASAGARLLTELNKQESKRPRVSPQDVLNSLTAGKDDTE